MIRPARLEEMPLLLDWAAAEGWNPGLADAACFHAADPDGFLIAERAGQAVGCMSAVRQGPAHGFVGFYIVRPEWRGQGIGMALWRTGMARLAGRVVCRAGAGIAPRLDLRRGEFRTGLTNGGAGDLEQIPIRWNHMIG